MATDRPVTSPDVAGLVAGLEADLAAVGFPADLTRAPRPEEVRSRTNYAAIENLVNAAAGVAAARGERTRLDTIAHLERLLAGLTAEQVLQALDQLAASGRVLPGVEDLLREAATDLEDHLSGLAVASISRAVQDFTAAGVIAPGAPAPRVTPGTALVVAEQSRRVAVEGVESGVRAVRGAAWSTPRAGIAPATYLAAAMDVARASSARALHDTGSQAALAVHGRARTDAISQAVSPERVNVYASELLDRNTCTPCSHVDGTEFATMAAALELYPSGQYIGCLGGSRCRGTLIAVAATETRATLPVPGDRPARRRVDGSLAEQGV